MRILIFEDDFCKNLYPLSVLRPVYNIKAGAFSIREKIEIELQRKFKISLHCRNILSKFVSSRFKDYDVNELPPDDYIFFNGRVVFGEDSVKWILKNLNQNSVLKDNDTIIAANVSRSKLEYFDKKIKNPEDNTLNANDFENFIPQDTNMINYSIVNYPWDLLDKLNIFLNNDLEILFKRRTKFKKINVLITNGEKISIAKSAVFYSDVFLNSDEGIINIENEAVIEPFTFIKGPVYIGKNVVVKSGTRIYGPASIGWGSKVSGEISGSVFHSCVNKQHDGFIGNTYACPFVNFGADTVTSNLKNNYSKVRVKFNNGEINTGMQFLGSIAGDHTKFGINTMLNTGTIAGVFANVAGGGFPDKKIDSFEWNIIGKEVVKYKVDEALATARIVMARRHIEMSKEYEELVRQISNVKF
jgi:UDP-N-acetylglucosamine diphosphorylase/glucosamine-1-phosphate N-acetyltransferase